MPRKPHRITHRKRIPLPRTYTDGFRVRTLEEIRAADLRARQDSALSPHPAPADAIPNPRTAYKQLPVAQRDARIVELYNAGKGAGEIADAMGYRLTKHYLNALRKRGYCLDL